MEVLNAMSGIIIPAERIERTILFLRKQRVIVDRDLAKLYGVPTKVLKQAVRRNISRFPDDFMFVLTPSEFKEWRSQFVTSKSDRMGLRHGVFRARGRHVVECAEQSAGNSGQHCNHAGVCPSAGDIVKQRRTCRKT